MAKSFFTQILDLAGISLPDPNTQHDDPSKYRLSATESQAQSASGLTRVEQYLQKKNPPSKKMTRVEQYLAKKQAAMESEKKAQTPETTVVSDDSQLTGVARYLARKQASQQTVTTQKEPAPSKPKTRVEKYLAQKQSQPKQTSKKNSTDKPAASVKKTEPGASAPATGVDKYLSRKKSVPVPAPSKEIVETAKPEEKPPVEVTKAKKPAVATESKEETPQKNQKNRLLSRLLQPEKVRPLLIMPQMPINVRQPHRKEPVADVNPTWKF